MIFFIWYLKRVKFSIIPINTIVLFDFISKNTRGRSFSVCSSIEKNGKVFIISLLQTAFTSMHLSLLKFYIVYKRIWWSSLSYIFLAKYYNFSQDFCRTSANSDFIIPNNPGLMTALKSCDVNSYDKFSTYSQIFMLNLQLSIDKSSFNLLMTKDWL